MQFSSKLAARVGALGLTVAAVVVPASAAFAGGPVLGVSPDTGLVDAQSVTVTGSGFPVSTQYFLSQCSGTGGQSDCDVANATGGMTGADGSISTTYTVHTGAIGNGTCAPGSTNCFLVATTDPAAPDPSTNTAIHPIAFKALPSITVVPSKGIHDGDKVKVSGKNFPANTSYVAVVCSSKTDQSKCDVTDGDVDLSHQMTDNNGSFSNAKLPVYAKGTNAGVCKPGGPCFVAVTTDISGQGADKSQDATARIHLVGNTIATKTHAAFVSKTSKIVGTVKAHHKGVAGLKEILDRRKGGHWKKVDSFKSHKGGKFHSSKLTKSGKYRVKTPKQTKGSKTYGSSHSKAIHV